MRIAGPIYYQATIAHMISLQFPNTQKHTEKSLFLIISMPTPVNINFALNSEFTQEPKEIPHFAKLFSSRRVLVSVPAPTKPCVAKNNYCPPQRSNSRQLSDGNLRYLTNIN